MRKWGIKKKFCFYVSIFLVLVITISLCVYSVVANFIENNNKITFYTPDGAPALACAKLLAEDKKDDGIEYTIVQSNGIESLVTSSHESRNADFCVLPLTDSSTQKMVSRVWPSVSAFLNLPFDEKSTL